MFLVTSRSFFSIIIVLSYLFLDSNPTLVGDIDGHSIDLDEKKY
jgi:hypothetical protein